MERKTTEADAILNSSMMILIPSRECKISFHKSVFQKHKIDKNIVGFMTARRHSVQSVKGTEMAENCGLTGVDGEQFSYQW